MSTAFPSLTCAGLVERTEILPEPKVFTGDSGKEVRTRTCFSPRYRYEIPVSYLTSAERTTLANFLTAIAGADETITYTDPYTSGSVTCRLEDYNLVKKQLASDIWGGMSIVLLSLL
jgi:hypothetical protein